jgi:DNA-binding LacI/PurR family transcriptional regulator
MQIICEQLGTMATRLGPNSRFPRVQDLRAELGVSLKTLDGALREMEQRGVIYRINGVGVFVAPAQKTIGLVYAVGQTHGSPFWHTLIEQMRERAKEGHEQFRFYVTHPMPEQSVPLPQELVEAVKSGQLQGIIFVGDQNEGGVEWLQTQKVPMVTFATPHKQNQVSISYEAVVEKGAYELLSQGCRHIGIWSPFGNGFRDSILDGTFKGLNSFKNILRENHLSFDEEAIWRLRDVPVEEGQASSYQEQGYQAVHEVYTNQLPQQAPDGLIIINDLMSSGALIGFRELGLRVGEDIKIATHANKNSNVLLGYESQLTLLQFDSTSLARALFARLEMLMNGEKPAESQHLIEPVVVRPAPAKPFLHPLQSKPLPVPISPA